MKCPQHDLELVAGTYVVVKKGILKCPSCNFTQQEGDILEIGDNVEVNSITANDYFVKSPKVKANPKEALLEAIDEGNKESKSIALIALSLTKAVEDIQKRLEALEKQVK